jgi:hypothetical protein
MFTNKVNQSIICGWKGKERVPLIKILINTRVWKRHMRDALKSKEIGLSDQKV